MTGCVYFGISTFIHSSGRYLYYCTLMKAIDCVYEDKATSTIYSPVPSSDKNSVKIRYELDVWDCSQKGVMLVDPTKPIIEYKKDLKLNSQVMSLYTESQARGLFKAEDAGCPITSYELVTSKGDVISSFELMKPGRKGWQAHYDWAKTQNNGRLLTLKEAQKIISNTGALLANTDMWVAVGTPTSKDWMQIGDSVSAGTSHVESSGFPDWSEKLTEKTTYEYSLVF